MLVAALNKFAFVHGGTPNQCSGILIKAQDRLYLLFLFSRGQVDAITDNRGSAMPSPRQLDLPSYIL